MTEQEKGLLHLILKNDVVVAPKKIFVIEDDEGIRKSLSSLKLLKLLLVNRNKADFSPKN